MVGIHPSKVGEGVHALRCDRWKEGLRAKY
jgi:hypothetical protein